MLNVLWHLPLYAHNLDWYSDLKLQGLIWSWPNIWSYSVTASTFLERLSTRFRSVFIGIFDQSSKSTFMRSGTDVDWEVLTRSLRSNLSQRFSIGLRSGLCLGQSWSSTANSLYWCAVMFNRKGPSLILTNWEHEIVQNILCWSIKSSFH